MADAKSAEHGDFACNFALAASKLAGKNPREIGDALKAALSGDAETVALMIEADCEITVCSNSAVDVPMPQGVTYGSQDDHAAVLDTSDRVVALT